MYAAVTNFQLHNIVLSVEKNDIVTRHNTILCFTSDKFAKRRLSDIKSWDTFSLLVEQVETQEGLLLSIQQTVRFAQHFR